MAIDDIKPHNFKKGRSGNPKGRPKGAKDIRPIKTMLKKILLEEIEAIDPITKEVVKGTIYDHILVRQAARALGGDDKAIDRMFDRLEGKPTNNTNLTGDGLTIILPKDLEGT